MKEDALRITYRSALAATLSLTLASFETRSSAQNGPIALRKLSRNPEEISLSKPENEEPVKLVTGYFWRNRFCL
ncbi:hypothetical protein LHA31_06405 [Carnobacterium viridans]|uniref:Uncharacterized protein n=1 Tax=Carnobacterium viridans TaxID=174587 RepID=A0A1H1A8H7_9LACT|nr:hypothetical protein [Carnobacterium viridans]UDE94257.1 hypothetical protein LHA31_06405 [Carnobacterium viridans]SDQ35880.1 hypothetical protein SAMN04487752_1955 [Carnobacterium viridans]